MDPSLIYTVDVEALSKEALYLPRDAIRVASLFDGQRRLWEVLRDSSLSSRMTMSVFTRLRDLELVTNRPLERAPTLDRTEAPAPSPDVEEALASAETIQMDRAAVHEAVETATIAVEPAPVPIPSPTVELDQARPTPASTAFDDSDLSFFDSYVPEDESVDTFWDLEENPRAQRAGRQKEKQLRTRRAGWLAQLLFT